MSITEQDVRDDYQRFIRHEAMRANVKQDEIKRIIYHCEHPTPKMFHPKF